MTVSTALAKKPSLEGAFGDGSVVVVLPFGLAKDVCWEDSLPEQTVGFEDLSADNGKPAVL